MKQAVVQYYSLLLKQIGLVWLVGLVPICKNLLFIYPNYFFTTTTGTAKEMFHPNKHLNH